MFILIRNKITGEYSTIYKKDKQSFLNLKSFFDSEDFNFEIIEDNEQIKHILEQYFTSKGRGEEYNEDLPSVTKIAYMLFPIDIKTEKFLLKWKNNTPIEEQTNGKDDTLSRGTFCHYILEQFICDKQARDKDKPLITKLKVLQTSKKPSKRLIESIDTKLLSDIERYIQMAYQDTEIISKIKNLDELKPELEYLAKNCLLDFIKEELIFTDLVYSEIFLKIDDYIQGSIDLTAYKDGKFSIIDYKTTSVVDKKTGKPKFKTNSQLAPYARQLYVYNKLLEKSGMTHIIESGKEPDYYIVQLHLVNGRYKKFEIPKPLVKQQGKIVEKVIKWYWDIRNDIEPDSCEDYHSEQEDLEFLTL